MRAQCAPIPVRSRAHVLAPWVYVGQAEQWDAIEVDGDVDGGDCLVRDKRGGKVLAVATIGRDVEALRCEAAMEQAV